MALILDGKKLADDICASLKVRTDALKEKGIQPRLTIVTSGDDSASKVYVRNKLRRCAEIGIEPLVIHRDELSFVDASAANGGEPIIYQMPMVTRDFGEEDLAYIMDSPENDVDGFVNKENVVALATGKKPCNYPCTPKGIMRLLEAYDIPVKGETVCIIGRSNIVGRPLARMMEQAGATVTLCHSKTQILDIWNCVEMSDIVVSATGVRNILQCDRCLFNDELVRCKVIIDVGMNRDENGKLCGDIEPEFCQRCRAYTPVPGGVGPMTVAMLMENVIDFYETV